MTSVYIVFALSSYSDLYFPVLSYLFHNDILSFSKMKMSVLNILETNCSIFLICTLDEISGSIILESIMSVRMG